MMHGWTGRILHIDLTLREYTVERPPAGVYERHIGGRGLAGYYLKDSIKKSWDSPDMPLLFFTGPLTGTPLPASNRMTVMSRSPLTGTVGDSSVGGNLGLETKKAGWDGIVVRGKSTSLCGIRISDSEAEFMDAGDFRGKHISEVVPVLGEGGASAVIGPAAENRVLFSCIVVDGHHFAGRNGLGLVMAGKNLKYVKVKGSGKTGVYDMDEITGAREEIFRLVAASPILAGGLGLSNYGTGALYDLMHARRMMPTDNFKATCFKNADRMNAWNYTQHYKPRRRGCPGCRIACKRVGIDNRLLPEFETMSHFSALIGNNDLDVVVEANRICAETGMDTISAGATLACYREIAGKDFKGEEVIDLLQDIAYSQGVGRELKLGSYRYAKKKRRAETSMTVKKQELPAYDPRGAYGMALGYAVSTRGGCHLRAYPISHEILRKPVATDRFTFSGKARIIKISEDLNSVVDSLTACKFLFFAATLEEYARAFQGATGIKTSAQDLLKAGERICYNERVMNSLNGFTSADDDLPGRFFTEPGTGGDGITIPPINRRDFLKTRLNYYRIRGLDENGMPLEQKCRELGL